MFNVFWAVVSLLSLLNFILFIVVLIRLFKEEGVLKGILGIVFCFYPFIWGWVKHRRLEMTKIMLLWTAAVFLPFLAGFAAVSTGLLGADFNRLVSGLVTPSQPRVVQKRVKRPAAGQPLKKPVDRKKQTLSPPAVSKRPAAAPGVPGPQELDYSLEMKKVDALLKAEENRPEAYYNRAWLNARQGNLAEALEDYSRALDLNGIDGDALYNRGVILAKLGRFPDALRDFSDAIRLQSDAADALCNRGNIYFKTGKTDLALKDYEAALILDPNDGDVLYNRALVYNALGDKAKAGEDLEKAAGMRHDKTLKHFPDLVP